MKTRCSLLGALVSGTVVALVVAGGLAPVLGEGSSKKKSKKRQSFDVMIGGAGGVSPFANPESFAGMFFSSGATSELAKLTPMAQDGTLKNFRIHVSSAPGALEEVVFTVRKNQVDTNVSCVVDNYATSCTDLDSIFFGVGDLISVKAEKSAGAFAASFRWVAIYSLSWHRPHSTTQRYMHLSPAAIEGAIRLLDQPLPDLSRGDGDIVETADR